MLPLLLTPEVFNAHNRDSVFFNWGWILKPAMKLYRLLMTKEEAGFGWVLRHQRESERKVLYAKEADLHNIDRPTLKQLSLPKRRNATRFSLLGTRENSHSVFFTSAADDY